MLHIIENMSIYGQVAMATAIVTIKMVMDYMDRREEAERKEA